ncbi:MAG TPA: hypothetical protein VFX30_04375, partial [bacterium]|nr:hypothetical protein [bacterium]
EEMKRALGMTGGSKTATEAPTIPEGGPASSPPATFTRTILQLKPDGTHTVSTEEITRTQQAAEFEARKSGGAASAGGEGDCASSGLWLFDASDPGSANQLCVLGLGTASLQDIKRPDGSAWAGVVKVVWPGASFGFLSPAVCRTLECPSQNFQKSAAQTDADANGQAADSVTLYALKPFADSWENVHRFAVADGFQDVSTKAPRLDFIWSGDRKTTELNVAGPSLTIGHYMPMNGLNNGEFVHCSSVSDCVQPGYQCAVPPTTYRPAYYYVGEKVCMATDASAQKHCTQASDCAGGDGNCAQGLCYMSIKQQQVAELAYWKGTKPGWIVYRSNKTDPAWWGDSPTMPFDPTNPDVMDEMLKRIRFWKNLDGVSYSALSLDVVFPANYYGVAGAYKGGTWASLFSGAQGYDPAHCAQGFCDTAWKDAVLAWLKRLRDEMHKDGVSLIINIGYSGSIPPYTPIASDDPALLQIFGIVDGVFDEGGFSGGGQRQTSDPCKWLAYDGAYNCSPGYVGNFDLWSNYARYVKAVQALGKPYFTKNAFPTADYQTPPTARQIEWALASYLLVKEHSAYFYVTPLWDDGSTPLYPQLDVAIGHPCEPMQEISGSKTRMRTYSHGFVVVNAAAGGTPGQAVTLPEGHSFLRWRGGVLNGSYDAPVSGSLTAEYQTGYVLSTADSLCQ